MHKSFVTTTAPLHLRGIVGGSDFSSIAALLKAMHYGDLLRVIALLFIIVNSTGVICVISLARHLLASAGGRKKSLPRTLAPLSPAKPVGGRGGGGGSGQWLQITDVCINDTVIISIITVYYTACGNKEEQSHRGNVWVSIITYSLSHLT